MAIALVGSVGSVSTGTTTVTPSFAQATTAGNLLIAWVAGNSTGLPSFSGTGWTALGTSSFGTASAYVFYKQNCGAGETAPTITVGAGTTVFAVFAEFSGADTSSAADKNGSGGAITATSPQVAANSATDTTTGELFVSSGMWTLSKAGTATTADTYNNATPSGNLNNDATSIINHYRLAYGITTANAAADQTSQSNSSMNLSSCAIAVASFKVSTTVARVPRNPGIDSDLGVLCKAHQAIRRWRHGAYGILIPELSFVH